MHSVANKLAQYGRGGDDTLVHMNRSEVAGLNALNHLVNNRPLSKNPVTGMPEAMDLTDILAGLGIGIAAALTGGAAAAAAPALLGATAGAAGGAGALGLGALAGAATGAGLNAGKAAIKGDQDIGMAAAFGAGSGALGGLGGAAGAGNAAVTEGAGNVAAQNISTVAKDAITPGLTDSATQGLGNLAPTATQTNLLGDASKFITPDFATSTVPPVNDAGFAGLPADLAKSDQIMANAGKLTGAAPVNFTNAPADLAKPSEIPTVEKVYNPDQKPGELDELVSYNTLDTNHTGLPYNNPNLANPNPSFGDAMSQSFAGLKDTVMNPGQHQGLLTAQLGMAGLEDSYKQQGLTEQAGAKQAADIVGQYRKAGIMPSELPKGLTDIANKRKSFAAGGTIRDVQGLGAIPSGYINQQSMTNFYPQSMIPQAQPLQSTQPIRHEVIGYAKGGELDKAKDDYKQLLEGYPNASKFFEAMRQSADNAVPTQEQMADPNYLLSNVAGGASALSTRIPQSTVNAYKLFRTKANDPDTLYPLFVNADKPVPMNEWTPAEAGAPASQNAGKVKSLLGPLAYRPGWHAGDVPVATHIGKGGKPPVYRPSEHTWAEVEFPNDVDWQSVANERGVNKNGILVPKAAHITDQIPEGGFYRYKTSPNMTGNWLIGGEMKVNRPISDEEVKAANAASGLGVEDLPRFNEYLNRNMGNPAELSRVINSGAGKDEYFQILKKAKDNELDDLMRMYGQNTDEAALKAMDKRFNKYLKTGMAEGGIVGYADGGQVGYGYAEGGDVGGGDEGLLHGPGTGQSDGIAGLIEGAQGQEPVRLADGEFVVPADVVSALGDGSTKAGAQALYDMLDRIRQQAYGHIQQANQVDPQAVMPV